MKIATMAYLSSNISKSLQPTITKSTLIDLENMLTYEMRKYPLLCIKNPKMMIDYEQLPNYQTSQGWFKQSLLYIC